MKNKDKSAFPLPRPVDEIMPNTGLTKREYFAAMAMQGLCANSIPGEYHRPKELACEALEFADELIKQLDL